MATLTLDTHKFIQTLKKAGMPESQAEAIVEGLHDVSLVQVATRQDVLQAKGQLQVEIREVKNDLLKWMISMLLGQAALFAALVKFL
jgi:hypothetical protein